MDEVVQVYLSLLTKDENAEVFDKTNIIFRFRQASLPHRSQSSIEKRMCNISSVLKNNETHYFEDYEPIEDVDGNVILMIIESLRKHYPSSLLSERNSNIEAPGVDSKHTFNQSSSLSWSMYYSSTAQLDICFKSGDVYRYDKIPRDLINKLYETTSSDDFFYENIAYAFSYLVNPKDDLQVSARPKATEKRSTEKITKSRASTVKKGHLAFSTELSKYVSFRNHVEEYCATGRDMKTLNTHLKKDQHCSKLRSAARAEFQTIYNLAAEKLQLPQVSVFLPTRKKVSVRGIARTVSGTPTEIRIYAIHGPSHKEYKSWKSTDMKLDDNCGVCETLVHEIAHIYEAHFHSTLSHDKTFIEGYLATEKTFLKLGLEALLLQKNRFTGCPSDSKAAILSGKSRAETEHF